MAISQKENLECLEKFERFVVTVTTQFIETLC